MKSSTYQLFCVAVAALCASGCASKLHPQNSSSTSPKSVSGVAAKASGAPVAKKPGVRKVSASKSPAKGKGVALYSIETRNEKKSVYLPARSAAPGPVYASAGGVGVFEDGVAPTKSSTQKLSTTEGEDARVAKLRASVGDAKAEKILAEGGSDSAGDKLPLPSPFVAPEKSTAEAYPSPKFPLEDPRVEPLRDVLASVSSEDGSLHPRVTQDHAAPPQEVVPQARFRFGKSVDGSSGSPDSLRARNSVPPRVSDVESGQKESDLASRTVPGDTGVSVATIAALGVGTVVLILLGALVGYRLHLSKIDEIRRGR